MFNNKNKKDNPMTIISSNTKIIGDICFQGKVQIDGHVTGNLMSENDSSAMISISKSGILIGEVSVPIAHISGHVTGDIHTDESLKLSSSANIKGNLFYNMIEIEQGSQVQGKLMHSYLKDGKDRPVITKNRTVVKQKTNSADVLFPVANKSI